MKENEKVFFDTVFRTNSRGYVDRFYAVTLKSRQMYEDFLFSHVRDKSILECGCGTGSYALSFARRAK